MSASRPRRDRAEAAIRRFLARLPVERGKRVFGLRQTLLATVPGVEESMRRGMPTYDLDGRWVAIGSPARHLAVYFCAPGLIDNVTAHHPELDCGTACVRVRDTQFVPVYELSVSFRKALLGS